MSNPFDRHAKMDGKRKMQPYTSRGEDIAAAQAEAYVAQFLNAPFNVSDGADNGWDIEHAGLKIDVKWAMPRSRGANLIVKAKRVNGQPLWEPRFTETDVYVLVEGLPGDFSIVGWQWSDYVVKSAKRIDMPKVPWDPPYFLLSRDELNPPDGLLNLGSAT